jgi:hypothetical protein
VRELIRHIIKEDFDWIDDIPDLIPGEEYLIKNDNGTWSKETFLGKGLVPHPSLEGQEFMAYKFKTKNSHGSRSERWFKEKIENGEVIPYEEGWTILNHVDQSDNLEDIEGRDFAIYFNKGINVEETIPLQEELFKRGFSFHNHEGFVTSEDTDKKIKFIESINWDTSNWSFRNMPNDDRDKKILSFAEFKERDTWYRSGTDEEFNEQILQEDLWVVTHHNALLLDGYKLLGKLTPIKESTEDDWGWAKNTPTDRLLEFMKMNGLTELNNTVIVFSVPIGDKLDKYIPIFNEMGHTRSVHLFGGGDTKTVWVEFDGEINHHENTLEDYVNDRTIDQDGYIKDGYQYEYYDGMSRKYKILDGDYLL